MELLGIEFIWVSLSVCFFGSRETEYIILSWWPSSNLMGSNGQMRTRLFDLVKVTFPRHRDMCIAFVQVLSHVAV